MQKNDVVTVKYNSARLRAIRMQMAEKGLDFDKELMDTVDRLYEKYVPTALKKFIGEMES